MFYEFAITILNVFLFLPTVSAILSSPTLLYLLLFLPIHYFLQFTISFNLRPQFDISKMEFIKHHSSWIFSDMDVDDINFICEMQEWRSERWEHTRINWDAHVTKLLHENAFNPEYRMSLSSFSKLCNILDGCLQRDHTKSNNPDEPITTTIIVACSLRILAGGKKCDQKHIFGLSQSAVHNAFDNFIEAVSQCDSLDINLPKKTEEWEAIRSGFTSKSFKGIFNGCVGAIDGFFQETTCPTKKESGGNVTSFFSGHYESYGLNCQAVCDSNLKFIFFGVVAPGKIL